METQAVETKRKPTGRARVKARHLSREIRQVIFDQFLVRQSTEDIAEEYGLPARTVSDVVLHHAIRPRPAGPVLLGRAA